MKLKNMTLKDLECMACRAHASCFGDDECEAITKANLKRWAISKAKEIMKDGRLTDIMNKKNTKKYSELDMMVLMVKEEIANWIMHNFNLTEVDVK